MGNENLMFLVGFVSQWAKANPKVPNLLVVAGVCALGYAGYWIKDSTALEHGVRGFLDGGFQWALRGVFALQATSATASGLSAVVPPAVAGLLPVTKN